MPTARKKRAAPEATVASPSLEPEPEGPPSKRLRGPAAATATAERPPVPLLSVQQYVSVVNELLKMEAAAPFVEPLDYVAYGLPDYPKIVKHPMDLGTIQSKLGFGSYQRGEDVLKDVRRLG
jgi:bromodomain-containing factor 1